MMFNRLKIYFNLTPYKSIKDSEGLIKHYFRNGKVTMSYCNGVKCSKCNCNL